MPNSIFNKRHIPNIITSMSIISGGLAVFLALEGERSLIYASYLIFLSAIFDFFDGFAARRLNAVSDFGKQLDSLADAISFGLAPTAVMYELLKQSLRVKDHLIDLPASQVIILITSFLIAVASVIRLAKFNIDDTQKHKFRGLPTPANAIFIASIPLIKALTPEDFMLHQIFNSLYGTHFPIKAMLALIGLQIFVFENTTVLMIMFMFTSFLMVSNIPMFSFKFENFKFVNNKLRYFFIIYSIILIIILQSIAIPVLIMSYIIVSLLNNYYDNLVYKRTKRKMERIFH